MNGGKLAGGNPKNRRVENDFYATNPTAVEMLLLAHRFKAERVLEPCVGNGNIANIIRYRHSGADITAVDIVDRGYPKTIVEDFLEWKTEKTFDTIITNPPFSLAGEFIEKSMTLLSEGGATRNVPKDTISRRRKTETPVSKVPAEIHLCFPQENECMGKRRAEQLCKHNLLCLVRVGKRNENGADSKMAIRRMA